MSVLPFPAPVANTDTVGTFANKFNELLAATRIGLDGANTGQQFFTDFEFGGSDITTTDWTSRSGFRFTNSGLISTFAGAIGGGDCFGQIGLGSLNPVTDVYGHVISLPLICFGTPAIQEHGIILANQLDFRVAVFPGNVSDPHYVVACGIAHGVSSTLSSVNNLTAYNRFPNTYCEQFIYDPANKTNWRFNTCGSSTSTEVAAYDFSGTAPNGEFHNISVNWSGSTTLNPYLYNNFILTVDGVTHSITNSPVSHGDSGRVYVACNVLNNTAGAEHGIAVDYVRLTTFIKDVSR